jgi:hypothetical protein
MLTNAAAKAARPRAAAYKLAQRWSTEDETG